MSVVVAMEDVGPCRRQLRIEVPQAAIEAEEERALGALARKAKMPGFRKGKIPPKLVRAQFGAELRQEVLERILPRYVRQATAEKELEPLLPPEVDEVHYHAGEPLRFRATIEIRPPIELRNLTDFNLPEMSVEATPAEVADTIAEMRRGHAEWIAVDRPAARGDRAEVEIEEDGDNPAAPTAVTVEVGARDVWEELSLALAGTSPGRVVGFERREGEGEAARQRRFRAKVGRVLEAKLPELDAAFAQHFGPLASVEELEADVAKSLRHAKERELKRRRENALIEQLVERHPTPLPEGVVHHEIEELLRDYAASLARRGVDLEKAGLDWQSLGEQAKPEAERRVHARIVLDAIADRDRIEVVEEEFEAMLAVLARAQGVAPGALRARLDGSGELRGLRVQMRRDKVLGYLLGERPVVAAAGAPAEE